MTTKFHGVSFEETTSGWVHFGFLRLLHTVMGTFRSPKSSPDERRPEWPSKWFDRKFDQGVRKYQDCFWKFDRAAGYFYRCVEAIKHHHDSRKVDEYAEVTRALADIPLYLDAMLIYLRVGADCLANVIPNLYGQRARKESIPRDRFRRQNRWLSVAERDFDPAYTSILEANLGWFETLAGKGPSGGLRDVVIHHRGLYQIGWSMPGKGGDLRLFAGVVGDSGFIEDDLVVTLKSMVTGYFDFLDHLYEHFAAILRSEVGEGFFNPSVEASQYVHFGGGTMPSLWVYPTISDRGEATESVSDLPNVGLRMNGLEGKEIWNG